MIVEEDTDVNYQDEETGNTALHMSAANGHLHVIKYLVGEKAANVNIQNKMGNTALHWAAL